MISREAYSSYLMKLRTFFIDNFLLISYTVSVIIALCYPYPGKFLNGQRGGERPFRIQIVDYINTVLIFLVSGMQLKSEDLLNIRKYYVCLVYGLFTINFVTTLLAFGMVRLPFPTTEFPVGFAIFCSVPTTLAVGVTLTTAAKGDQVLSLILTVLSNMLGVVTVPFLLQLYISNLHVPINPLTLFVRLIIAVLIPSIIGILARKYSTKVSNFVKENRIKLSMFNNINLVCIVWMTLSSAQNTIIHQNGIEILIVIIASLLQHIIYLIFNYVVTRYLIKFELKQSISLTIMGSQKSSPVALAVISIIASGGSEAGLYVIPCVIGQLVQIFVGSLLAKYLAKLVDKYESVRQIEEENINVEGYASVVEICNTNTSDTTDINKTMV